MDYIRQEIDDGSPLFISVISRIEILSGVRKGKDETIRSLFDILTSVDVDLAIADEAGEYMRKFLKSHALSIGDAVIAVTANGWNGRGVNYLVCSVPAPGYRKRISGMEIRVCNPEGLLG